MQTARKIVKVKLMDSGMVDICHLEYPGVGGADDNNTEPDRVTREGKHEAHPDLVQQFHDLRIHMAAICEQAPFTEYEDDASKLDLFKVTQISISGADEHEGIVITGQRILKGNKVLNINTPVVKVDPDHSEYNYASSLAMIVDQLLQEADQYLNGKYAPSRQLDMFNTAPDPDDDSDADEEEEKPKKKKEAKMRKLSKNHPLMQGIPEGTEISVG